MKHYYHSEYFFLFLLTQLNPEENVFNLIAERLEENSNGLFVKFLKLVTFHFFSLCLMLWFLYGSLHCGQDFIFGWHWLHISCERGHIKIGVVHNSKHTGHSRSLSLSSISFVRFCILLVFKLSLFCLFPSIVLFSIFS